MLFSERLCFRPFKETEFHEVKAILGNKNVCEYLPGKKEKSDEELQKWHQFFVGSFHDALGNKIYAICLKDTGEVIGYGGLGYVQEFDQIEIMYGLKESVWGNGYATEVSLRMKEFAKELGIHFLIAIAHIENIGSQKVLMRTGFVKKDLIHIWGIEAFYYEMEI